MRNRPQKSSKDGAEAYCAQQEWVEEGLGQWTDHQRESRAAVATGQLKYLRMTLQPI